jgi:hypothetical protein
LSVFPVCKEVLAVTVGAFLLVVWVAQRRFLSSSKNLQYLENIQLVKVDPETASW